MKKLIATFLIFPIFISAEEQTFEECIAVAESERASEAYEACLTEFEVENRNSCVVAYTETSGYTEEDALEECISLEVSYQYSLFMDDRPAEFFDIFDVKDNLTIDHGVRVIDISKFNSTNGSWRKSSLGSTNCKTWKMNNI